MIVKNIFQLQYFQVEAHLLGFKERIIRKSIHQIMIKTQSVTTYFMEQGLFLLQVIPVMKMFICYLVLTNKTAVCHSTLHLILLCKRIALLTDITVLLLVGKTFVHVHL